MPKGLWIGGTNKKRRRGFGLLLKMRGSTPKNLMTYLTMICAKLYMKLIKPRRQKRKSKEKSGEVKVVALSGNEAKQSRKSMT